MNVNIKYMESARACKFRIYTDGKCRTETDMQLNLSKDFYNKLLEKSNACEKDKAFEREKFHKNFEGKPTCFSCWGMSPLF